MEGVAVLTIHINPCAFSRQLSLEAVFLYQEVTVHSHTSLWHSAWRVTVLLHDIRTRPKNSVDLKRMDLWIVLERKDPLHFFFLGHVAAHIEYSST